MEEELAGEGDVERLRGKWRWRHLAFCSMGRSSLSHNSESSLFLPAAGEAGESILPT